MPVKTVEAAVIASLEPTAMRDTAIDHDNEVLVQYDPARRPLGEFGQSKFIAFHISETGENERLVIRPGVQKMARSQWEKWANNTAPLIKAARSHGVLRKVSDRTDLLAIEQEDPYLAQDILKHTFDGLLLGEWAKGGYLKMSPVLQEAMTLKSDSGESSAIAKKKFLFGQQVA
jgi:hypothetical protein